MGTSASPAKIQVKPFKIYFQQSRTVTVTTCKRLKNKRGTWHSLPLKQISENVQVETNGTSTTSILISAYLLFSIAVSVPY